METAEIFSSVASLHRMLNCAGLQAAHTVTNEEQSRRATTAHMGTTAEGLSAVHDLAELPRTPGPRHTQTFGPLVGPAAGRAQGH